MSAKFIDFLRSWGESLFTSKKAFIAQQSLPDSIVSSISVPSDAVTHTTTSPIDGWACLISGNGQVTNFQLFTNGIHSVMSNTLPSWYRGFIPVKKGEVVYYRTEGSTSNLNFVRSIGGGLSSILQSGGALCLRLKNVLSRFSSSQVVKQLHLQKQFLLMCPHLVKNTQRHLTGLYALVEMRNVLLSRFRGIKSKLLHSATTASGQAQLFQLEKVQQYGLTLKELGRCSVTSLLALVQANLAFEGGAL